MLKEAEMVEKGLQAVKECLSILPASKIRSTKGFSGKIVPDYRIDLEWNGSHQSIKMVAKPLGTPKSTREAVNSLLVSLKEESSTYGVFVAPYLSVNSANICREAGIGYVDLSGNCYLSFQQVFIYHEKGVNQYPLKTGLSSIYSPKSERILRVLLTYPYRPWKTVELAKEAQVSLGMISHVSKKLEEEEWLKRSSGGICLIQPEQLLEAWSGIYSIQKNLLSYYYTLKSISDIERKVGDACHQMTIPYALTGFSAANYLAPMVKGQRVMIYIDRDISSVADRLELKRVDSGANVILIQPYDAGVFWNLKKVDDLQIASSIQVYLDLKRDPGRGEEAAKFLYQGVIKPTWQQPKMNMMT